MLLKNNIVTLVHVTILFLCERTSWRILRDVLTANLDEILYINTRFEVVVTIPVISV